MQVSRYICEKCILFDFKAKDKEEVLKRISEWAAQAIDGISKEEVLGVLGEREELGSTGIGGGVAIPHAKLPKLEETVVIVAISKEGVPFDAVDGQPVFAFFVLLAPDNDTVNYLRLLAKVSKLIKQQGFLPKIKKATDQEDVREIIRHLEFGP